MKRVIFLDIDGVLNTTPFLWATELPPDDQIMPERVWILNRILRETGAVCVLSSDWRMTFTAAGMEQHLRNFGFEGQIIAATPVNSRARFTQISDWFDEWPETFDDFVILDDIEVLRRGENAPLHERNLARRFFLRVNDQVGLTDDDADRVIRRFAAGPQAFFDP